MVAILAYEYKIGLFCASYAVIEAWSPLISGGLLSNVIQPLSSRCAPSLLIQMLEWVLVI